MQQYTQKFETLVQLFVALISQKQIETFLLYLHLKRAKRHAKFPKNLNIENLIEICLSLEKDYPPVSEIKFIPVKGVLILLGYGASPINVLNFGNKMFLNNGFHRVYA